MLHFILGKSGCGKTERVMQQVKEAASAAKRVILLVPEHASFEMERRASALLGSSELLHTDVLSFPRLAENIFRDCGGLSHRAMNDVSRIILMHTAVQEVQDALTVYRQQAEHQSFLTTLLAEIREFKRGGITPERLRDLSGKVEEEPLAAKLRDISLIYEAYQAILQASYHDPLDDLALASRLAEEKNWFCDAAIWVDGFDFFSADESAMLEIMLRQAAQITFSMTANALDAKQDIFIHQKKFLHRLIGTAGEMGVQVAPPVFLEEASRFRSEDLITLQQAFTDPVLSQPAGEKNIRIIEADTVYEEIRFAAAEICRLVREESLRYNDCAIVCRDPERYEGARSVLEDYGIPYYYSQKESLLATPPAQFLCTALDACRGSINTKKVLALARSEASGLTPAEAGELENYCFTWSVKGENWCTPFTNNPEGMSDAPENTYAAAIACIETARQTVIGPLLNLRRSVLSCNGKDLAISLFCYAQESGMLQHFCENSYREHRERLDREWNGIVDILDLFSDSFAERELTVSAWCDLFRLALAQTDLGNVPNTVDQVVLAAADRIRLNSPRAVFVLGVNEGLFPGISTDNGLFSTREREAMNACGAELLAAGTESALREQFILYTALSAASERLYISYARHDVQGEVAFAPSAILSNLMHRLSLPAEDAAHFPTEFWVSSPRTARMQYAVELAKPDGDSAVLAMLLDKMGEAPYCAVLEKAAQDIPAGGITPENARRLLGWELSVSPTAIDTYYHCPFQYFCDKMLRLRPRQKVEFSPFESGSAIHYVFEMMLNHHGSKGLEALSPEQFDAEIRQYLAEYIHRMVPDEDAVSARFRYQFERLHLMLRIILRHMAEELAQSEFVTAATEAKVGKEAQIASPELHAADGTPIRLQGSIDRVDVYHTEEQDYLRVIDYKSGSKEFRLEEVYYGLNMQMLIYLYAACDDKNGSFGAPQPAGVLYVPSKLQAVETAADVDDKTLREEIDSGLKMKGIVLEDEAVLRAMEPALSGKYIPASLTAGGAFSKSSRLQSREQMAALRELVYRNITEMADHLLAGRVEPLPVQDGHNDPCSYCKYAALCNNTGARRLCKKIDRKEAAEL